jgi:hypothetical protein
LKKPDLVQRENVKPKGRELSSGYETTLQLRRPVLKTIVVFCRRATAEERVVSKSLHDELESTALYFAGVSRR